MPAVVHTSQILTRAGFAHGFSTRRRSPAGDDVDLRAGAGFAGALAAVAEAVPFDAASLWLARQVHGARVLEAEGDRARRSEDEADAIVVAPRRAGGVRVADCVPVLVGDVVTGRAAAIHAGWRGVEAAVVGAALTALSGDAHRRVAAIGPSIGPCCFEVGVDVAERIARAAGDPAVVARRAGDKAYVDLRSAVRRQLLARGLADQDVEDVGGCTRCDAGAYFSYRRDGEASGRMLAVIVGAAMATR